MRNLPNLLLFAVVLLAITISVHAQAPATMSFQGYLEFEGAPADTSLNLTFKLVDGTSDAANVLWTELQSGVVVEGGIFNVILGSVTPLPSLEFSKPLWIRVEEGADERSFTPITELTATPYSLGLVLPQIHDVNIAGTAFAVNNIGSGYGIRGQSYWESGRGLEGFASAFLGQNYGVYGLSSSAAGTGVYGVANTTVATDPNYGVYGKSYSNTGIGVYGTAPMLGVYGEATADVYNAYGIKGVSSGAGLAIYGLSSGTNGAIYGHNTGTGEAGHFEINNTGNGSNALFAFTNGTGRAGYAQINNAGNSANALEATTNGSGYGLKAHGGPFGVRADAATSFGVGVSGETATTTGIGVRGLATASTGATYGVLGQSDSNDGHGVHAIGGYRGVHAETTASGTMNDPSAAIYAKALDGSDSQSALAGLFDGRVQINRLLYVDANSQISGHLTVEGDIYTFGDLDVSGTKNFRIDHPLDPANRYLYHFAMESDEVLNVYSGNVTTDEEGYASVTLPDWFEAINKDYRYQLTVVGTFAQAIIAEKIHNNRFVIETNEPSVEVSWQVTAMRSDSYMRAHPPVVEEAKPDNEKGTYLDRAGYGVK
ncbi:MAG: hypothetical protein WBW88_06750 [Rhodothermales bacterium]